MAVVATSLGGSNCHQNLLQSGRPDQDWVTTEHFWEWSPLITTGWPPLTLSPSPPRDHGDHLHGVSACSEKNNRSRLE